MPSEVARSNESADSHFNDDGAPIGTFLDWLMPVEVGSANVATSTSEIFRGTGITAPGEDQARWLYINLGDLQNGFPGEQGDWPRISLARLHAKSKIGENERPTDANSLVIGNVAPAGEIDLWIGLDMENQIMIADNGNLEGNTFTVLESWL